jgi:hypothetical protein
LVARAEALGARIQVVRRQTARYTVEEPAVWLADVSRRTLTSLDGTPDPTPLVLVCTHSTRDACCARRGLPALRALRAFAPWHSSHLGGHRFAATLAVLPAGVWLGRVPAAAASALVEDVIAGTLPLAHLRGVAGRTAAAQAVELHARRALGLTGIDDVVARADGDGVRVRVAGDEHVAHARWEPTGTVRPLSCGEGAKTEDPGMWSVSIPTLQI